MGILDDVKAKIIEQVIWAEKELRGKTGADKKAAVVKKLDDLIQLPAYLEWVDDVVLSWLVDEACKRLNEFSGHKFANIVLDDKQEEKIAESMEVKNASID